MGPYTPLQDLPSGAEINEVTLSPSASKWDNGITYEHP